MDTLELLSVIDIIKNEKLYQAKIDALKKATEDLAEAKFIAATVEQANTYRDQAIADQKSASDMLELATKQVEENKQKAVQELEDHKRIVEQKVTVADRRTQEAKNEVASVRDLEAKCIKWDQDLSAWSQQLNQKDLVIKKRENLLNARVERMKQLMKEEI